MGDRRSTTNQVRQILMNELGLTRESVREMVEEIVADAVDKHISTMKENSVLDKMVIRAMKENFYDGDRRSWDNTFSFRIGRALEEQAKAVVKERVSITITGKGE